MGLIKLCFGKNVFITSIIRTLKRSIDRWFPEKKEGCKNRLEELVRDGGPRCYELPAPTSPHAAV